MPKPNRYAKGTSAATSNNRDGRSLRRIQNQHQSPLFQLPAELREAIWLLVLPRSSCSDKPPGDWRPLSDESYRSKDWQRRFPRCVWSRGTLALLQTCRRIYLEATPLFYSRNSFDIVFETSGPVLHIAYDRLDSTDLLEEPTWTVPCSVPSYCGKSGQKISGLRRSYLALVTNWLVTIPTHLGLDFEKQEDEALTEDMRAIILDWGDHEERWKVDPESIAQYQFRHRKAVLKDFRDWLKVIGPSGPRPTHMKRIEFSFRGYIDWNGIEKEGDNRLAMALLDIPMPAGISRVSWHGWYGANDPPWDTDDEMSESSSDTT